MGKGNPVHQAVLRTLCYSDIFDYPLESKQVHRFLIHHRKVPEALVQAALNLLVKKGSIGKKNDLFFLKGRSKTVGKRRARKQHAKRKIRIADSVGNRLKHVPGVKMVALTGALAMENTDAQDDIDLMIVARANRLWLTRLIVVPAVSTIANRRKPSKHSNSEVRESWVNAICLNLFLDEDNLAVPKRKRNLYTAHEVGQAKPVIDKDGTYESFLRNNTWVDEYLPNLLTGLVRKRKKKTLRRPPNHSLDFLERLAFKSQKVYMRSKRTREIVQRNAAFFHPRDTERLILNEYRRRLQSLTSAQGKSHKKGRGRERDK